MKGLLIKDFKLFKNQYQFFLIVFIVAILLSFSSNVEFMIGYLSIIGTLFTLSTISYDEYNNGYPFLFTLPIDKKGYAIEKYIFGLITSVFTLLIATGIVYGVNVIKGQSITNEGLLIAAIYLPILILMLSIMIPLQLKYGGEKGRIAMIVIFGIVFLGIYGLYQVIHMVNFNYMAIITKIASLSTPVLILIITVLMLLILGISIQASIHVMKKKEF